MMGKCHLCTKLTRADSQDMEMLAGRWNVKPAVIALRLIQYILDDRMGFFRMLQEFNKLEGDTGRRIEADGAKQADSLSFRLQIDSEIKDRLRQLGEVWGGYRPSDIIKCLIRLFLAGKIDKNDIWY